MAIDLKLQQMILQCVHNAIFNGEDVTGMSDDHLAAELYWQASIFDGTAYTVSEIEDGVRELRRNKWKLSTQGTLH